MAEDDGGEGPALIRIRARAPILVPAVVVLGLVRPMMAQPKGGSDPEVEVINEINAQRIGSHSVADLHLPDPFLRRVGDRLVRLNFQDRFRMVLAPEPASQEPTAGTRDAAAPPPVQTEDSGESETGFLVWAVAAVGLVAVVVLVVLRRRAPR